jgi:carbonic anhydrase
MLAKKSVLLAAWPDRRARCSQSDGDEHLKRLLDGYRRFQREEFPGLRDHFHLLSDQQSPETLFVTCADSRVVPNLILQTEPGDLFICRNVGNVVPPHGEPAGGVSATIEYAVQVLGVKRVIICGHSDCGAIKAWLNQESLKSLPAAGHWLQYVESARNFLDPSAPGGDIEAMIHANVVAQLENLKTHSNVAAAMEEKRLEIHGWFYDILSGTIDAYDPHSGKFVPLDASREG